MRKQEEMETSTQDERVIALPEGFTARGAQPGDLEAAVALFNRWSRSTIQQDEITDIDGLRNEWCSPGFDIEQDIRIVFGPSGQMAGYIEVWTTAHPPVHPWLWGRVDPDCEALGIGSWLLSWGEGRARLALDEVPADVRVAPRLGTYRQAERARQLFAEMGFQYIRSSYHMRIDMEAPPPPPAWPHGIDLRLFNLETDLGKVYRADIESFRDHFGFVEEPYEEGLKRFEHFQTRFEGFDPTLWFLAMEGDEVAGICLCRDRSYEDPQVGYVADLAVRRPWRRRGIGLALLRHSFGEFYRRGKRKAGLGVDAENLTGALHLYESAGMHVHTAFDLYEKEIRPGREISVQSLSD